MIKLLKTRIILGRMGAGEYLSDGKYFTYSCKILIKLRSIVRVNNGKLIIA